MIDCRRLSGALLLAAMSSCGPQDETAEVEQGLMICPTSVVEGADVYQGDGTVDWGQVAGSGRGFAFAKASQGDYNTQSTFGANWAGIRAAGMLRGPYHYFDATVDGVAQAQLFLSVVADAGGFDANDLPPALDVECPTSSMHTMTSGACLGTGADGWAPTATIRQRMFDWLQTVEAATGRKPVIYSYVSWFSSVGVTDATLADYPLWVASISSTCATVPAPWTTATFWQYSVTTHVPGIGMASTSADEDRFVGDEAQLMMFAAQVTLDAGSPPADGGALDAGAQDAGAQDAGVEDSGQPDAGAAAPDAGMEAMAPHGCGCGAAGSGPALVLLLLLARAAENARSRRRRSA